MSVISQDLLSTVLWAITIRFVSTRDTRRPRLREFQSLLTFSYFSALVHPDNQLLGFLAYSAVDALRAIELQRGEFLVVFQTLGLYVDSKGRKSRDREIMYPAIPLAVSEYHAQTVPHVTCI